MPPQVGEMTIVVVSPHGLIFKREAVAEHERPKKNAHRDRTTAEHLQREHDRIVAWIKDQVWLEPTEDEELT